jgi:hypothetical protein
VSYLSLLPPVAFLAVLVRFLVAPSWPGVVALAIAGALLVGDGWRRLSPRVDALEKAAADLPELRKDVARALNRGGVVR